MAHFLKKVLLSFKIPANLFRFLGRGQKLCVLFVYKLFYDFTDN